MRVAAAMTGNLGVPFAVGAASPSDGSAAVPIAPAPAGACNRATAAVPGAPAPVGACNFAPSPAGAGDVAPASETDSCWETESGARVELVSSRMEVTPCTQLSDLGGVEGPAVSGELLWTEPTNSPGVASLMSYPGGHSWESPALADNLGGESKKIPTLKNDLQSPCGAVSPIQEPDLAVSK